MKHTQGEWILNESKSEIVSSNDCSKNGGINVIAQCYSGFNYETTMDECKANAKLIAAAPDLLEALMACVSENGFNTTTDNKNRCLEAIKKATE